MLSKLYDNIKKFIKSNYKDLILLILVLFITTYQFPYYVDAPGGLINTSERVNIEGSYKSKGSFNMAYVREMPGTIASLFFAFLFDTWDIIEEDEVTTGNETVDEMNTRGKLYLESSNNNAMLYAYTMAGKEVEVSNNRLVLLYKYPESKTDMKIGDIIRKVDNIEVKELNDISNIIANKKEGDIITLTVENKKKEYIRTATLTKEKKIGIVLQIMYDIETDPNCEFKFTKKESGPSGGLMTALTIYNNLVEEDITYGLKIAGTGTIENDGSVGEIGGIKYKLIGVVKKKADIFFCPEGSNYKEAMKVKEEKGYDIEIVGVETFDEALEYLKNYKKIRN